MSKLDQTNINIQSDNGVPKHIIITADGNRRYAKSHGMIKMLGHRKGVEIIEDIITAAKEFGVKYITFWLLSTENFEERTDEVKYMTELAKDFAEKYKDLCIENGIRIRHFGRKDRLPEGILNEINEMEEQTKDFTEYNLGLAIDYGGRNELIRAFQKIKEKGLEITEETVSKFLDTAECPDPDLLIRTGGNRRLSGITPWAGTYAELYFTDTLFPDFSKEELKRAIDYFRSVKRNFGK